jgi:hypothetical protein
MPPQVCNTDIHHRLSDFDHDDDLMRYKYEVLSNVYEKSLDRCFVGSEGTCLFLSIDLRLSAIEHGRWHMQSGTMCNDAATG